MKYSEMTDTELFILALDKAGYIDVEPDETELTKCFMDYVDQGAWANLFIEDGMLCCDDYDQEEITVRNMAITLIKLGESDNWDYGTVGEVVSIDDRGLFTVGDVYKLHIRDFHNKPTEVNCMVVNKEDEYKEGVRVPFFMGVGELWDYDKILDKVNKFSEFNLGDKYSSLIFTDN